MKTLQKAIEWAGGVNALGRVLDIDHSNVCHWKRTGKVPAKHAVTIEQMTKGKIKAVDLLADFRQ